MSFDVEEFQVFVFCMTTCNIIVNPKFKSLMCGVMLRVKLHYI